MQTVFVVHSFDTVDFVDKFLVSTTGNDPDGERL